MNASPENPSTPPHSGDRPDASRRITELENAVGNLRSTLQTTLALLVLLVAVVNLYLWQELRMVRLQKTVLQESVRVMSAGLNTHRSVSLPWMERLVGDLYTFGDRDPEFGKQVLAKYPVVRTTNGAVRPPTPPTGPVPPLPAPAKPQSKY